MRVLLISFFLTTLAAEARIGETSLQFVARYGPPKDSSHSKTMDKMSPLLEGAIHHVYEYKGWKIRAAFLELDGPAVRMDFQKIWRAHSTPRIRDYELQAIMTANTPPSMMWQRTVYDNPNSQNLVLNKVSEAVTGEMFGQKMWRRSDGAILSLQSNLIVRLELPAAREHETQLKIAAEQKARASVPQF